MHTILFLFTFSSFSSSYLILYFMYILARNCHAMHPIKGSLSVVSIYVFFLINRRKKVDMNCIPFLSCSFSSLLVVQISCESITKGFCSNSSVNIPHAQALQQDPSAFWRDRMIDGLYCVLTVCLDTIWYTISCISHVFMVTSLQLSTERSCLIVETGVRYSPSKISLCYCKFPFHNCHHFQCSTSFGPVCFTIVAFPCTIMFLLLKFLLSTAFAEAIENPMYQTYT